MHATVVINRIDGLARPSVCLFGQQQTFGIVQI